MKSKFLLLADFGKNCTKFIKFVAKTAKDYNAELFILVIIDLAQTKEMIYDNIINDHKAKINTEAERIKKIIYTEFPSLSIKLIIKEGFVLDSVVDVAKREKSPFKAVFLKSCAKSDPMLPGIVSAMLKNSKSAVIILPEDIPNSIAQKGIL